MGVEKLEEFIAAADLHRLNDLLLRDPALAKAKTYIHVSPLMLS